MQLEAARMLAAFASVQGRRPVVLSLAAEAGLGGVGREGPARQFYTNQNLLLHSGVLEATVLGLRAVTRQVAEGKGAGGAATRGNCSRRSSTRSCKRLTPPTTPGRWCGRGLWRR